MLNPQFAPDRASPYSREGWHPTFNHHSVTSCRVAGVARYAPTEDHSVDNARRSRKGVACSAPTDAPTTEFQSLLWAEAKRGIVGDIYKPLVQLVLTIGRARTFDSYLPPPFLGVLDAEKIVFLPYKGIMPFFALNDFNWNVLPRLTTQRANLGYYTKQYGQVWKPYGNG